MLPTTFTFVSIIDLIFINNFFVQLLHISGNFGAQIQFMSWTSLVINFFIRLTFLLNDSVCSVRLARNNLITQFILLFFDYWLQFLN